MNVQRGGLAKANNSQNPAGYNMRSPILWDVAPHLTRTGTQLNQCYSLKIQRLQNFTLGLGQILWNNKFNSKETQDLEHGM